MAKVLTGEENTARQLKNANRFEVDFVENDFVETEETLGDEMTRFDLDRVSDFDKVCDYDGFSSGGKFVPLSGFFVKFWSDSVICRKYPNLSRVANHVSELQTLNPSWPIVFNFTQMN